MTCSIIQMINDKKLIADLAAAAKDRCLSISDGNGVFSFDFQEESLRINLRRTYDRLMELGGEKLLRKLLKEGKTCLQDQPGDAKKGVRPIKGTDKFFLQTNAGETKMLTSILCGIAAWDKMDKDFDEDLIVIDTSSPFDVEEELDLPGWEGFDPLGGEFTPPDLDGFVSLEEDLSWPNSDRSIPQKEERREFELGECLAEPGDDNVGTYIIEKDGWRAVAEVDLSGMPRLHRLCTPLAFTSITRPANWMEGHLLVERFGKKGVYNWKDNSYPIPCEYDSVELQNENLYTYYRVSIRGERHIFGFWGAWVKEDLPPCPKCDAVQTSGALYCHRCGTRLKGEEEKKEAPKSAPVPQPEVKKEEAKEEKKIDPNVPTLDTFGTGKAFFCEGSRSHVLDGSLRVTVRYNDDDNYDTDPEHFLYGNLKIKKRGTYGDISISELSNLEAFALAEDGIFYAKDNEVFFLNIYGEKKSLTHQNKVISLKNDGNGVLTVEYVESYYYERQDYRTPMDWWEIWEDVYRVNTKKREIRY